MKMLFCLSVMISMTLFLGCEEVIELELADGETRLVVEGRIEKPQGTAVSQQEIRLTLTDDYFSQEHTPPATGAEVVVYDDTGNSFQFQEVVAEPGLYSCEALLAETGRTYTLTIEYAGETYSAEETLLPVAPIDSLYQVYQEDSRPFGNAGSGAGGWVPMIDYSDPAGVENFYQWEVYVNGVYVIEADPGNLFRLIQSDELYDGQQVEGHTPDGNLFLDPGQVVLIRQLSLSNIGFDYLSLFFSQSAERGLFDTPPATIRGNVANDTDPDHYPLGYFGAAEVAEAEMIIQAE